jgi:hypothetical protein
MKGMLRNKTVAVESRRSGRLNKPDMNFGVWKAEFIMAIGEWNDEKGEYEGKLSHWSNSCEKLGLESDWFE